jgi:hypothetical protein
LKKENNKNEEKMTEMEDIRASHNVDAIMTDDKDEEIVFEQDHGTNTLKTLLVLPVRRFPHRVPIVNPAHQTRWSAPK